MWPPPWKRFVLQCRETYYNDQCGHPRAATPYTSDTSRLTRSECGVCEREVNCNARYGWDGGRVGANATSGVPLPMLREIATPPRLWGCDVMRRRRSNASRMPRPPRAAWRAGRCLISAEGAGPASRRRGDRRDDRCTVWGRGRLGRYLGACARAWLCGVSVAMQYVDTAQQQEGDAVIAHARRHYV